MQNHRVESQSVEEGERERKVIKLVGQDGSADPCRSAYSAIRTSQLTYLRTANLASGRTPPEEPFEEEVKIRKYRSTSCREPKEYSSRMMVSYPVSSTAPGK